MLFTITLHHYSSPLLFTIPRFREKEGCQAKRRRGVSSLLGNDEDTTPSISLRLIATPLPAKENFWERISGFFTILY
jgi:hypothetical protein